MSSSCKISITGDPRLLIFIFGCPKRNLQHNQESSKELLMEGSREKEEINFSSMGKLCRPKNMLALDSGTLSS